MARDKEKEIESIKTLRWSKVSFTRKDKVRSLASMSNPIKVRGTHVDVESLIISSSVRVSSNSVTKSFKYEVAP